jgi:hypothetical protein
MREAGISFIFPVLVVYYHSDLKVSCSNLTVGKLFYLQENAELIAIKEGYTPHLNANLKRCNTKTFSPCILHKPLIKEVAILVYASDYTLNYTPFSNGREFAPLSTKIYLSLPLTMLSEMSIAVIIQIYR